MKIFLISRLKSIRCALTGLAHVLRSQKNAWIHAAATVTVLLLASLLHLAPSEWCWLIVAIAAVWAAESLNTALELLCDVAHPNPHPLIAKAKDSAAAAVLLTALASLIIATIIILPHLH